jgi:hypothetical protein
MTSKNSASGLNGGGGLCQRQEEVLHILVHSLEVTINTMYTINMKSNNNEIHFSFGQTSRKI